jgi:hypothetical protein
MHVSHHMQPPPELNTRAQVRKTPSEEEQKTAAFSQIANLSGEKRRNGSKQRQQQQQDADLPPLPTTSGLIKARLKPGAKPAPFAAVTSVTEFWTELVMASKDEGVDKNEQPPALVAQQTGPSLLDLFAQAVK